MKVEKNMSDSNPLLTPQMIEVFKTRLKARRVELEKLSKDSRAERAAVDLDQSRVGRLSRIDAIQMQAMNQAIEVRRENERIRIDNALQLIQTGDFGFCVMCDDEISLKRLQLDPSLLTCVRCAQ